MAYTGTEWYGAGATITFNAGTAMVSGIGEVSISETPTFREVKNVSNAPYAKKTFVTKKAEITINVKQLSSGEAFPDVSDDTQTLVITSTGCYFSGNVIITGFDVKFDDDETGTASGTIKCETIDGSYTLAKSAS